MRFTPQLWFVVVALACACGPTSDPVPAPQPAPPPAGLDILVVTPVGNGLAGEEAAFLAESLGEYLVNNIRRIKPSDIRVAAVQGIVENYPGGRPPLTHPGRLWESRTLDGTEVDKWSNHIRPLGVISSGLPSFFAATVMAIDGRNAGFPRPDAMLALVLFAAHDDCTLARPELMWDGSKWPDSHYFYYTRCSEPLEGMLADPADYVDALLDAHPQRIFVATMASRVAPVLVPISDESPELSVDIMVNCGDPFRTAPRVAQFNDLIVERNHPRLRGSLIELEHQGQACASHQGPVFGRLIRDFGEL